jgi:glycosyltransferase involved in cell wall biosynthesis
MQQTSFPVVTVIIDDASTDHTVEVLNRFLREHFCLDNSSAVDKETDYGHVTFARHKSNANCFFAVICLKENHYSKAKDKHLYYQEWANTKYVAICEGDDYWMDPLKLQKQVDILEADDSLMAVVTNSSVVDRLGKELQAKQADVVPENREGRYDLRSFMYKIHHYPTATVCYRRTHTKEISKMLKHTANPYLGDWTFWIALHIFGDFYYLDKVTSAYRINPTSITHTVDRVGRAKAHWTICKAVQDILPDEYDDIRKSLDNTDWVWIDLAFAYKASKRYVRMLWCLMVAFVKSPKGLINDLKKRFMERKKLRQINDK